MSFLRKKYLIDSSDSEDSSQVKKSIKKTTKKTNKKTNKNTTEPIKNLSDNSDVDSVESIEIIPSKYSKSKDKNIKKNITVTQSKKSTFKVDSDDSDSVNSVNSLSDSEDSKQVKKSQVKIKTESELKSEYNLLLKKYWGYDELKPTQFEIIRKVLNDKTDICAILATGFGKSLCYQLPHLITGKCVIVVSPLIALMHEQGLEMQNKKIPVAVFNSDNTKKKKEEMKKEILSGKNKLLYMTPEYLITAEDFITELDVKNNLAFVCIDEAHAVSTWGLDFRPGYTKLGVIRNWAPTVPILTLTATASTKVREDIVKILKLSEPELIVGNFDRPNLLIRVQPRYDDIMLNISTLLNKYSNEYIIIYCKTRDETDLLAEKINKILGIKCESYHAGMGDLERQAVQQDFIDGTIKCIIATIAFGMGINIPNVRLVVHYNCPKNIESYYQEIGRAGRDGKPSECVLFYSEKDFKVNRYFLKSIENPIQKAYQENQIRQIEKYVFSSECRRKVILENFGQKMESCINCDNCNRKTSSTYKTLEMADYTLPVYMVLNILSKINDKFGSGMLINILTGKQSKVKDYMSDYSEFGSGNFYGGEKWWKELLRNMINNELIQESQAHGAFYTTLGLTSEGVKKRTTLVSKYPSYSKLDIAQSNSEEDDNSSYHSVKISYPKITAEDKTKKTRATKATKTTKSTKTTIIANKQSGQDFNKYQTGKSTISNKTLGKINLKDSDSEPETEFNPFVSTKNTKCAEKSVSKLKTNYMSRTKDSDDDNCDDIGEFIGKSNYSSQIKKKFGIKDSDSD